LLDGWPDGEPWLLGLWELAALTRADALPLPSNLGRLLPAETPPKHERLRVVFERVIPPPAPFLRWLLTNPTRMQVADPANYGATGEEARAWRRKLFSHDPQLVREAQREGQRQLEQRGADHSAHQWWAFEGFTHIDCCLMTENCVLFIEGKRTEVVSTST